MLTFSVIIVLFCGSSVNELSSLYSDSLLTKHFNQEEIAQLDSIRTFFNNYVLNTCEGEKTINVCYQQFFGQLLENIEVQTQYHIGVPYAEQEELYEQINEGLFGSIWRHSTPKVYVPSVDSLVTYSTIDLRSQDSRYMEFLKDVSAEEPYFGKYIEPIIDFGHLSPSLTQGMLYNHRDLDFSNERHQLILAIHFLTVNDQEANQPK